MVAVKDDPIGADYHTALAAFPPLVQLIEEGLATARPILRRSVQVEGSGPIHLGVTVSPLGGADPAAGVICPATSGTFSTKGICMPTSFSIFGRASS